MRRVCILLVSFTLMATLCVAQKHNLIESDSSFRIDGKIGLERGQKVERGVINSVHYVIYYSDGSGGFGGSEDRTLEPQELSSPLDWSVGCEKDPITDEKSCYMDRDEFRVWVDARGRSEVYIGSSHYPGSNVVIRIDKGAPIFINSRTFNGSFGYRASPGLINRIAGAKTVTTRFQEWPYKDYRDSTWSTYGFKEALSYLKWAVARIR